MAGVKATPIGKKDYVYLLFAVLAWGSAYVVVRSAGKEMQPAALAFSRVLATTVFFLPFAIRCKTPRTEIWAAKKYLLGLAVTGVACFILVMSFGLCHSTATNGSLINATNPIVTVFIGAAVLKTKVKRAAFVPLVLAVVGAVILLAAKPHTGGFAFSPGDLAFVVNVFMWAIFTVILVPFHNRLPAPVWGFWINFIGLVILFPIMLAEGYDFSLMSWGSLLKVIYAGVVCGGIATLLWGIEVDRLGIATAALFNNFNPLFSVCLAALFLGERMNGWQFMGAGVIMFSVLFYSWRDYQQHKKEQQRVLPKPSEDPASTQST